MKNQKGFIQIPFLIAVIVGVLVIGGAGYFGYKQFRNFQTQQAEQQKIAQEKEQQTQALIADQQKQLEKNQSEILALQKNAQKQASSSIPQKPKFRILSLGSPTISAQDIAPYLGGVGQVNCYRSGSAQIYSSGSGSLIRQPDGFFVLTNQHVITTTQCDFNLDSGSYNAIGIYTLKSSGWSWNSQTDSYVAELISVAPGLENVAPSIPNLNYSIGLLRKCGAKLPNGTPVVVLGYPAYGASQVTIGGYTGALSRQIVTDGIISGYDDTVEVTDNLPDVNYFVTAKMDAGNSGGIALAKDNGRLCVLGIPTWVSQGTYANTGMVQSINNIMYQK